MQNLNETSAMANESTEDRDIEYAMLAPSPDDPTTFKEVAHGPNKDVWMLAMLEELERMWKNSTWTLVKPPPNANIVGSRWTCLMKRDADNQPVKSNMWLVAQGFSQVPRVNFNNTFALTTNPESIRLILALANYNNWSIHQADYKHVYLNARLEETIYMRQPSGFEKAGGEEIVCLLQKAIYGLKQASHEWYKELHALFTELQFT
jgi:hypothetical protein